MSVQFEVAALPARLLTQADIGRLFDIKTVTVRLWVRQGRLPRPIRVGRAPHWKPETIARFLDAQGAAVPAGGVGGGSE